MKIKFHIPTHETIPTKLRLSIDGQRVDYTPVPDNHGIVYDFTFWSQSTSKYSVKEMLDAIVKLMCEQSKDNGIQWVLRDIEPVHESYRIMRSTYRVIFDVRATQEEETHETESEEERY